MKLVASVTGRYEVLWGWPGGWEQRSGLVVSAPSAHEAVAHAWQVGSWHGFRGGPQDQHLEPSYARLRYESVELGDGLCCRDSATTQKIVQPWPVERLPVFVAVPDATHADRSFPGGWIHATEHEPSVIALLRAARLGELPDLGTRQLHDIAASAPRLIEHPAAEARRRLRSRMETEPGPTPDQILTEIHPTLGDRDGAIFSLGRAHRYTLWRTLASTGRRVLFVMLNPSTAGGAAPDPTVTRCAGFARREGARRFDVVNLFSVVSTEPQDMLGCSEPVGSWADWYILQAVKALGPDGIVIFGWGELGALGRKLRASERIASVYELVRLAGYTPQCLHRTKLGAPGHPLYLPAAAELADWAPAGRTA